MGPGHTLTSGGTTWCRTPKGPNLRCLSQAQAPQGDSGWDVDPEEQGCSRISTQQPQKYLGGAKQLSRESCCQSCLTGSLSACAPRWVEWRGKQGLLVPALLALWWSLSESAYFMHVSHTNMSVIRWATCEHKLSWGPGPPEFNVKVK